jgi:hypothetical protein
MAKVVKLKPSIKRAGWHATYGTVLAGQAEVDGVQALAAELERKWGCDRLRLLVSVELREKFDRQRYLFNQSIYHGELEDVRTQAKRMATAWRALDRAADEMGAEPLAVDVWEVAMADGSVAIIVRDPMQASLVKPEGRAARVWTLEEIARLLAKYPELAAVKEGFPGAEVTATRQTISDPLHAFPGSSADLDDPLPDWMTGDEAFA